MTRARFVVRGIVQGVNFRAQAVREAKARGVTGCVWNRPDDAVEVIAEGDAASLVALEAWLARGPRLARSRASIGWTLRTRSATATSRSRTARRSDQRRRLFFRSGCGK